MKQRIKQIIISNFDTVVMQKLYNGHFKQIYMQSRIRIIDFIMIFRTRLHLYATFNFDRFSFTVNFNLCVSVNFDRSVRNYILL